MSAGVCPHGSLARVCLVCELEAEVDQLTAKLARYEKALREIATIDSDEFPYGRAIAIARAALDEIAGGESGGESLAHRHQEHYRGCNCLADSDQCCVPSCPCHKIASEGGRVTTHPPQEVPDP